MSPAEALSVSFMSKFTGTKTGETHLKMAIHDNDANIFPFFPKSPCMTMVSGSFQAV